MLYISLWLVMVAFALLLILLAALGLMKQSKWTRLSIALRKIYFAF